MIENNSKKYSMQPPGLQNANSQNKATSGANLAKMPQNLMNRENDQLKYQNYDGQEASEEEPLQENS